MNRVTLVVTSVIVLAISSISARAENQIGGGFYSLSSDGITLTGLSAVYANKLNDNFALDLGLVFGGSDEYEGVDLELDYGIAAKLKGGVTTNNVFIYASAGYATFNLEGSAGGITVSEDGNGALVGLGVDFETSEKLLVNLEISRGFGDLEDTNLFLGTLKYKL
jgi:hypothetical protein